MRNMQIAARLFNVPLLVQRHYAHVVATVLARRGLNIEPMVAEGESIIERPARDPVLTDSGILILPVVGALMHRGDSLDAMSGAESYTHLNNRLLAGLRSDKVKGILLDVDSPGGECTGCFEFADTIFDARAEKPIWAIANGQACSAAYAIAASAERLYATPSAGDIGSIGVVWMHVDVSQMLQEAGIVTSFVFAGKHKIDGTPYRPLPASVKADIQVDIDALYEDFVGLVARRRPMSADAVRGTEARCYRAQDALELKLVDGLLSLQAVVAAFEDHLHAGSGWTRTLSPPQQETISMSTPAQSSQTPAATISKSELDAAVSAARGEAYKAGRADAGKILASPHAKGRASLVAKLVGDADMSVERAEGYLEAAPQEVPADKGGQLKELMVANNPAVGAGNSEPAADQRAQRKTELASIGKLAARG